MTMAAESSTQAEIDAIIFGIFSPRGRFFTIPPNSRWQAVG